MLAYTWLVAILALCGGDLAICVVLAANSDVPLPMLREWTSHSLESSIIQLSRLVEFYGNALLRTTIAAACIERTVATLVVEYERKSMITCGLVFMLLAVS